ncbi:AT-rich interactive domain-containing protein 1-like [Impatiens glandulifera]|uniref:AT-rich interactive domain-containing protein 1-like n=1 Tax=Impatiens glandulifera TaxID=253017 RepID=UPI001FB0BA28|nr:AT-rich interactive domain-containing protein 1-like [Impatiens glandulifera]
MTRKKSKPILHKEPDTPSWFDFINDDCTKLVIPVGPRFQAEIPDLTGPPLGAQLRWLGTKDWPINVRKSETRACIIGKGRTDFCTCTMPGTIECVNHHILNKRKQLQADLGPAFQKWRFDEMGEDVSKLWNMQEQMKFINLVKTNPISQGKCFLKQAPESFPSRSRKAIVGYYFNVYIPRRISLQTRLGCKTIDTDEDEDDDDEATKTSSTLKSSKKRSKAERISSRNSKNVQTKYLTGHR